MSVTRIVPPLSSLTSDMRRVALESEPVPKQALRSIQNIVLARDGCVYATKADVVTALRMASQSGYGFDGGAPVTEHDIDITEWFKSVLQGYLDGQLESAHAAKIKHQVIVLVTSVPSGMDKDHYFSILLRQALTLLIRGSYNGDTVLVSLMTMLVNRTANIAPGLTSPCQRFGVSFDTASSAEPFSLLTLDTEISALLSFILKRMCTLMCWVILKRNQNKH